MIELIIVIAAAAIAFWQISRTTSAPVLAAPLAPSAKSAQVTQLSVHANSLYAEKKWLAAEKAYLNVLKLDHKNIGAYGHLGIIYSKQKNTQDAIECFEIAARLHPAGTTFHNLGLAYHENKNFVKAAAAFDKAIMFEPTASRYIGLSKARKQLADPNGTIRALEHAARLEPTERILLLLEQAYVDGKRRDEARVDTDRIKAMSLQAGGVVAAPPVPRAHVPAGRVHSA